MKNILITGGCGFLGRYLVEMLLEQMPDSKLKIIDVKCDDELVDQLTKSDRVVLRTGRDICRKSSIENDFADADVVIHLAGKVSFSIKDKQQLYNINTAGTENVASLSRDAGVSHFIQISSVAAIGYGSDKNKPVNEEFQFDWAEASRHNKHYSLSKHFGDQKVEKLLEGRHYTIIYPGLMLGPGDRINSVKLVNAIARKKLKFALPGGTNVVDVRDAARGITQAVKTQTQEKHLILSGYNLTFPQINTAISKFLRTPPPTKTLSPKFEGVMYLTTLMLEKFCPCNLPVTADNVHSAFKFRYFDNSKAKEKLGWEPEYKFETTVKDTVEWMEEYGLLEG
ncbi:Cholesterol dehydrogenase [Sedimentisphaera cyanobacteriorum]|uniref:Cholesterol dehydrogenase n=1 Tax=Sedimentisphaera cyanobacteriorum TaxID=1940790 RepID=A0A1Q2HQV3_9BACT|nr:NAD-dependent epimerase/dehydratase family protein [Sedimentisphaera cyanobacteriorum]AQQ09792.1 Cholesterol dehydrogenase [Sedimentisphaera cyanobacteriorum]